MVCLFIYVYSNTTGSINLKLSGAFCSVHADGYAFLYWV